MHLTALESSLSRFEKGKCTTHEHPKTFRCANLGLVTTKLQEEI